MMFQVDYEELVDNVLLDVDLMGEQGGHEQRLDKLDGDRNAVIAALGCIDKPLK